MSFVERFRAQLLELSDCSFYSCGHFSGKRSIGQLRGHLLTISDHPVEEINDNLLFIGVSVVRRDEKPGEACNGVGILAGGVGDGNTVIRGHFSGSSGGGGGRKR